MRDAHMTHERGRGVHVAVEGLDGSGKSTLIAGLAGRLAGGFDVREFRLPDPAAFAGADLLRVLAKESPPPSPEVLALGFAANRLASYELALAPWLEAGPNRIALSHRYVLSGLAYQSADGVPLSWLSTLNERVPRPDLTVFIDTDPAVCEQRVGNRQHAELFENQFSRMRAAFLAAIDVLDADGWPIEIIDGALPAADLAEATLELIAKLWPEGKA
jgi:dTMP kinase